MMEWNTLLNTDKLGRTAAKQELGRSPFNSDHDKIIFSGAFRRLAKKTQVHPLATNDHIHNRLTHSLEVACVGRSLGIKVGHALQDKGCLPEAFVPTDLGDIVQSACLAHDIGNPPFGHTGEEAIRNWFKYDGNRHLTDLSVEEKHDLLFFEGNAQGLRLLTSSEYHPDDGGMRLTYSTLASFIKYPWTSLPTAEGKRPKPNKYGVFQSELAIFDEIALAVGLEKQPGNNWYCRHPLVYLMEAADDFCYGILDLEDGLEMDILRWDDIFDILKPVLNPAEIDSLEADLAKASDRQKPALIRGKVISAYIDAATEAFINNEQGLLQGKHSDLISLCPANIRESVEQAKNTAKTKIFSHPRKIELEIGSYHIISTLLDIMCSAAIELVDNPTEISFRSKRVVDLIGRDTFDRQIKKGEKLTPKYLALMRVIDYISGMTDNYASYLAKQFNGMGESR
ncbi:MAG: deoxyguanosinetriphosphate triphosphohydrolase [Methylobacter sp.]|nr:deoxyguanosinetriphosphate triphosphohydrolase [Methylobacter sp.]